MEILRVIVEDLRHFGESVIGPDKEERTLMNKIWQKAAWAAHFFTSVTAFEHKRHVVQHGGSLKGWCLLCFSVFFFFNLLIDLLWGGGFIGPCIDLETLNP